MPCNQTSGANLYATLLSKSPTNLSGAKVLEISSGRGGGSALISNCYCPAEMVGVDISGKEVTSAESTYGRNGSCPVKFVRGDAMNLPFKNESFDVVFNVEASHGYPNYRTFIQEAWRVLRPGGAFLTTDFRFLADADSDAEIMADVFQKEVRPVNVTHMVLRAFHENQFILPFIDACTRDYMNTFKTSSSNISHSWKPHELGFGLANPTGCVLHAGLQVEQSLAAGLMTYQMYILTK